MQDQKSVEQSRVYSCSECGKTFKTAHGRLVHVKKTCKIKTFRGFQGYYCECCGLRFNHGDNFHGHLARRHGIAISGEGSDGRLGRDAGTMEVVYNVDNGSTLRVVYRRDA